MSLIQEALRRQQEEEGTPSKAPPEGSGGQPLGAPGPAPEAPDRTGATGGPLSLKGKKDDAAALDTPEKDPSGPAAETSGDHEGRAGGDKKNSPTKAAAGLVAVLLIILLLLGGLLWGGYYAYTLWQTSSERDGTAMVEDDSPAVATEVAPKDAADVATAGPAQDEPADFTEVPPEPGTSDARPPKEAKTPEVQQPAEGEANPTAKPDAEPELKPSITSKGVPDTKPTSAVAPAAPDAAFWPSISVDGFVGSASGGSALLNGSMVGVGERIDGVELVSIRGGYVWLRYNGKLKQLRKGQNTTD